MNAPCQGATHSSRGWSGRTLSPSPLQPRSLPLPSPPQAASQGADRKAKSWFAEPQTQNHKAECLGAGLMLREDSFVTPGGQVKSWRLVTQHFPSPSTLLPVSWFLSLLVPRGRVWRAWPLDASQRRGGMSLACRFPHSPCAQVGDQGCDDPWSHLIPPTEKRFSLFWVLFSELCPPWRYLDPTGLAVNEIVLLLRKALSAQVYWHASIFLAESGVGSRATDSRFKA